LFWPSPLCLLREEEEEEEEEEEGNQNVQMDLLQLVQMVLLQPLMGTRALHHALMEENPTFALTEVLLLEEDLVEDLEEDVPRKIKFVVMDPLLSLMGTRALLLVLMEPSQSVLLMTVKS